MLSRSDAFLPPFLLLDRTAASAPHLEEFVVMAQPVDQIRGAGKRAWTSLVYVILASAWILGSDTLLQVLAVDQDAAQKFQTWKGMGFVLFSGGLLYYMLGGWSVAHSPAIASSFNDQGYRRRIGVLIAGICGMLILVILVNSGLNAWLGRQRVLDTAQQQAQDLVYIIQEQTNATINAADLALRLFADSRLLDAEVQETAARMAEVVSILPPLRNLLIVDADGLVRIENAPRPGVPVDLSVREYFAFHRSDPSPELYISQPLTSERTGELAFIVSRRLNSPTGEFAGVASAAIDIAYFESLLDQVETRYQRAIVLTKRDGTVLVRSPRVEGVVGRSLASLPLFTTYLPNAESGNYRSTGAGDGVQRLFSYGAIPGRDLVVSLSLTEAEILSPWRRQNLAYGSIALAVVLTIVWLALLIFREISRRETLAGALRESEERFRLLWQTCNNAVVLLDRDSIIHYANPALLDIFGHEPAALNGQSLALLQPPHLAARHLEGMRRYLETGRKTLDWGSVETTGLHKDGHEFPVEIAFNSMESNGEPLFAGFIRDITERKRNEEELSTGKARLQALSEQLLRVHEEERSRLAHELHDEFGQTLTALKLELQLLAQRSALPQLEQSIALTSVALQQVRSMSLDLRPPQIDDIGLEAALEAHLERLATQTSRRIVFDSDPDVPHFTGPGALACFRIVQEAVNNALKHAGPCDIRVEYRHHNHDVELHISDNGTGFDIQSKREEAIKGNSLGLLNMEERARLLGGTVAIVSGDGAGAVVTARVPFKPWQQQELPQ